LFQPFQRLSAHRASNGSGHGLGLSIVRAIATAHGATITTKAPSGGGLSIKVTFPSQPTPDLNNANNLTTQANVQREATDS
jgi:signal transduction histidine kinase